MFTCAPTLIVPPSVGGGGGGSGWTWNPADKGASVTLSGADLVANCQSADSVRGTVSQTTGIKQFEVTISVDKRIMVGIANASATTGLYPGGDVDGIGYYGNSGNLFSAGGNGGYGTTFDVGDIIGVVVNFGTGALTFYKNGATQGLVTLYTTPAGALFPMVGDGGLGSPGATATINTTLTYPVGGASQW